ncbi:MAG: Major cardiolipin synthase ClsA [Pseudomonadales bacterium]|nr:Major cardiolipin synthase ClsA [Pseudomonadales bacterium]
MRPLPGDLELASLLAFAAGFAVSVGAAAHALLTKRDPRSAGVWISLCLFFPLLGALAYALFGNNRIRTRARRLHALPHDEGPAAPLALEHVAAEHLIAPEYRNLALLGRAASGNELLTGNSVEALLCGENAYPAMLHAIGEARRYVWLASYIFEARGIGREFIEALGAASARGVDVRVLLDGFGQFYTVPLAAPALRRAGVDVARFLQPRLLPPNLSLNLRNHRKILVVDGDLAFTGGMNIRGKHMASGGRPAQVTDVHFRLRGPVVRQIEDVFAADWLFSSPQPLPRSERPLQPTTLPEEAECRVIVDGPNEDLDKLLWVLVGAINAARHSIRIMTPYFLPLRELAVALQTAALRGVQVTVVLPAHNNFAFMTWAATHALGELLKTGVRVHFFEGPFLHTKLLLVDDYYAQIGSSNLDPRSLRLNFELAVEIYDHAFGRELARHFAATLARSRGYSYTDWRARGALARLRDAAFWVFSPYL